MGVIESCLRIRIHCADLESVLSRLLDKNIDLAEITRKDYFIAEITIHRCHFRLTKEILDKSGCRVDVISQWGVIWLLVKVLHRPVLLIGLALFAILLHIVSDSIFFINVVGNEQIAASEILSQAESCGIYFGQKASEVRSEEVKNALLQKIPDLQWVGVTTSGSVATIQVKERSISAEKETSDIQSMGIYATQDGIISSMIVRQGTPLASIGDRVRAGEMLVSGYTDCGIKIRAEIPDAEIYAYTLRDLSLHAPHEVILRVELSEKHSCHAVRIGKKVINFCNHSGIQHPTCVKMYEEDYWSLPGGFQLPVSVIRISYHIYETVVDEDEDTSAWLPQFATRYLQRQMIAGEILEENLSWNSIYELNGTYACHEIIGQVKSEENIEHNAEDH